MKVHSAQMNANERMNRIVKVCDSVKIIVLCQVCGHAWTCAKVQKSLAWHADGAGKSQDGAGDIRVICRPKPRPWQWTSE